MSSGKKGFSGLNDLVSDISEEFAPQKRYAKPASESQEPQSKLIPVTTSAEQTKSPQSTEQGPTHPLRPPPHANNVMGWVVGCIVLVLIVFIASSGRRKEVVSTPSSSVPVSVSPYVSSIAALTFEQDQLINELLQSGGRGETAAIEAATLAIEKAFPIKPVLDKAVFKDSRAKNKVGLQAHQEGKNELAAKEFLDGYKLNPYDPEIADNLGFVLYPLSDFEGSRKSYLSALIHSPRRASSWGGLGKVFAVSNSANNAASAFALAFRFTKSPRTLRQNLLTVYREDMNVNVRNAVGAALSAHYSLLVVDFVRPILGNLAVVRIPVYLPTVVDALSYEGHPIRLYAVNNEIFQMEVSPDGYRIPVASEPDCSAMACGVGELTARMVLPTDSDEGDPIELQNGTKGIIVKAVYRDSDHLVFRVGDIRYSFALGANVSVDIDAAKSALKLGPIPVEVFSALPKSAATGSPKPMPALPLQPAPVPAMSPPTRFAPQAVNPDCNTTYELALETFGGGVTVELRLGFPGSSTSVRTTQSAGGNVHFGGLCAGTYFVAIGNGESVSVTPVRNFESNMEYRSSIRMQRGSGNVTSKRRSDL